VYGRCGRVRASRRPARSRHRGMAAERGKGARGAALSGIRRAGTRRYVTEAFAAAFAAGLTLTLDEVIADAPEEKAAKRVTRGMVRESSGTVLTSRQLEIAKLVAEGLTNKEIAARLTIAQRTAEGHVERVLHVRVHLASASRPGSLKTAPASELRVPVQVVTPSPACLRTLTLEADQLGNHHFRARGTGSNRHGSDQDLQD